jgi:hypothetical protein
MVTLEKAWLVLMKYIVQVEISVQTDNDDNALFWVQDAIKMYGARMSIHRWIDTRLERESNNGADTNNQ